jgi:hypothetical protein
MHVQPTVNQDRVPVTNLRGESFCTASFLTRYNIRFVSTIDLSIINI